MVKENIIKFFRCLFNTPSPIPVEAQIEITNKCNFTCPMCPRDIMDVPSINMDFGLFKEVVRKLSTPPLPPLQKGGEGGGWDLQKRGQRGVVRDFILTGWGEPLLHPDFFEMVDFISSINPDARIRFTTNGSLLNKDVRKKILISKIEQVSISIDGLNGDGATVEGHSESKRIIENVTTLARERNSNPPTPPFKKGGQGGFTPSLVFQSTIHSNNLEGLKKLIELGGKIGIDRMNLVRLDVRKTAGLRRPSIENEGRIFVKLKKAGKAAGLPVFFINRQGLVLQMAGHFDRLCFRTVDHVYINVKGDVTPCCNLRKMKMGNLTKEDINEIWHGKMFRKFRANQLKVCKGCDAFKRKHHH
jgi:MoaA/NifB/PqqE/SkfB family radical SAM enzyme